MTSIDNTPTTAGSSAEDSLSESQTGHDTTNSSAPDSGAAKKALKREKIAAVQLAVRAALDRKAEDLKVLYLGEISDFTDRFVICSGTNERQVQAIAEAVLKSLRDCGLKPLHVEGKNRGSWILLDYGGELVIHIFLDEIRRYYDLERLWTDAPDETELYNDDATTDLSEPPASLPGPS